MKLTRMCAVCGLVIELGDTDALITHGYCRLCAAALMRQFEIWDTWKED